MAFSIGGSFTEDQIKRLNAISNDAVNETRKKSQVLDKDAFLKLMMTQLQNQNPLEPTDSTQYMQQMAQFSSVEQLTNIASSQETTNQLNALISKQLEDMTKSLEKLSGTGNGTSTEMLAAQKQLIEQNTKILEELSKMTQLLTAYTGQSNPNSGVSDQEIFSLLGM